MQWITDAGKQKSAKATAALPTVKVVSGEGEEASTSDAFDAGMEALAEKRNKVKEEGLRRVCTALRASVLSAHVEPRLASVSEALVRAIVTGRGSKESHADACDALALAWVASGPSHDAVYDAVYKDLSVFVHKTGDAGRASGALRALGVCTFVCMEPERVDAFLRQCEALCCARGVGAHIRRQALQSWSLAASALLLHNPDAKRTAQGLIDRCLPKFRSLLEHPHLSVRIAAGACLALVLGTRARPAEEDEEEDGEEGEEEEEEEGGVDLPVGVGDSGGEEEDEKDAEAAEGEEEEEEGEGTVTPKTGEAESFFGGSGGGGSSGEGEEEEEGGDGWDWREVYGFGTSRSCDGASVATADMSPDDFDTFKLEEEVEKLLEALAREGSRWKSKRDRRSQRFAFREYGAACKTGLAPKRVLNVRGHKVAMINDWVRHTICTHLAELLSHGWGVHLASNTLLFSLLGYVPPAPTATAEKAAASSGPRVKAASRFKDRVLRPDI